MNPSAFQGNLLAPRAHISNRQIVAAFAVAALADFVQLPLNLAALTGIGAAPSEATDLAVDTITAFILWKLLGFHWVLLPSFFLESIPLVDAAPTWLACVAFVVWGRKREERAAATAEAFGPTELSPVGRPKELPMAYQPESGTFTAEPARTSAVARGQNRQTVALLVFVAAILLGLAFAIGRWTH